MTVRTTTCHPDRKHHARGLCKQCYHAEWVLAHPEAQQGYNETYRERHPESGRAYYAANAARIAARERARRHANPLINLTRTAAKYGLTVEERAAILAQPCAICGGVATDIDHDHVSGRIRGPLCGACNTGIGLLRDDPELLAAAAEYLAARLPLLRIA